MTGSASSCMVVRRQDPPEQRGLHRVLRKSAVDDVDDDGVLEDDDCSEVPLAGAAAADTLDDHRNEGASDRGSPGSYHEEIHPNDSFSRDDRGGRSSPNASGPSYLQGLRRSLQDDFDRQLRWDSHHHVNDDEYDNDDSDSCHSDADWYPSRRSEDVGDDDDTDNVDGFESTLEEMERSLDYHDYLEREVDAYLEEPMRQLMREMEKEMELSYLDEFTAEDSYDEAQGLPRRRGGTEDNAATMSSWQPNDRRGRGLAATASSSSSYASVQATIQHAILNYHNWALASSNS